MSEAEARHLEALLDQLRDLVETARTMPMSSSVLVNRDEAVELLDQALGSIPAELRHARWLLKERQEYLSTAQRESGELVESARVQAERMVERSDIVREARRSASRSSPTPRPKPAGCTTPPRTTSTRASPRWKDCSSGP